MQPGPDPDTYPPIDPDEPVPDDPGTLSPDTPETLPPAPVEPMPGPDDPDSVPVEAAYWRGSPASRHVVQTLSTRSRC